MNLNYILATAGHVDHGKSSLVKALTGTDPDRLPEEKSRGITIDLGFAHFTLAGTRDGKPVTYSVGLVDVPGHEDFVKNMVAGVGSVDLALLVVAVDDGWMPQTEEHVQILTYLGISRAVVALTKIDLVEDEQKSIAAIRARLADSLFPNAPIIPTSTISGRGLDELKSTLVSGLNNTSPPRDIAKPRLPIDRVFTLQGIGIVVTGTLTGGTLHRAQSVIVQPSLRRARIRSIHTYNQSVESSGPGTRTALNLSDISADEVCRGHVITAQEPGPASQTWDVLLDRSSRATGRGIKDGALVRIHFGSANAPARVLLLDKKTLSSGDRALAQLRFDENVFAFSGDRFIIRDAAEQHTLAGGIILSADADRRHFHTPERRRFLETRAQAPDQPAAFLESELQRDGFAKKAGLLLNSRFSQSEIAQSIQRLASEKRLIVSGDLVADAAWWQSLRIRAMQAIDAAHAQNPDRSGLPLNDLRATMTTAPEVFDALLTELCATGFAQSGTTISRQTHRPALPAHLEHSAQKVRSALAQKPLDPSSVPDIAPDASSQQALRFLIQTGEALELTKEIVLLSSAYDSARDEIQKFLINRAATTSELRQLLGNSRRVIIPLLEHLDKQGVTQREGDKRKLKRS